MSDHPSQKASCAWLSDIPSLARGEFSENEYVWVVFVALRQAQGDKQVNMGAKKESHKGSLA